jgi:hypothetical protein
VQINSTLIPRTQTVKYLYPPGNDLVWSISITTPAGSAWDTLGGLQQLRNCTGSAVLKVPSLPQPGLLGGAALLKLPPCTSPTAIQLRFQHGTSRWTSPVVALASPAGSAACLIANTWWTQCTNVGVSYSGTPGSTSVVMTLAISSTVVSAAHRNRSLPCCCL